MPPWLLTRLSPWFHARTRDSRAILDPSCMCTGLAETRRLLAKVSADDIFALESDLNEGKSRLSAVNCRTAVRHLGFLSLCRNRVFLAG